MKGVTQTDFSIAITKSLRMPKFPGSNMFKPPTIKPIRFNPRIGKGFKMPSMPKSPATDFAFLRTNDFMKDIKKMGKL